MGPDDDLQYELCDGVLRLRGDLAFDTAAILREAFASIDGQAIELDLSEVAFMDSTGLHLLINVRAAHPQLRVRDSNPRVRRLLDITGTSELLFGSE